MLIHQENRTMERKKVVNTLVKNVKDIDDHYINGHIIGVENNVEEDQN